MKGVDKLLFVHDLRPAYTVPVSRPGDARLNNARPDFATEGRVAARRLNGLRSFDSWGLSVWVYRDQKAHLVSGTGGMSSSPRQAADWHDYGVPIGGGGMRRAILDPAAEIVSSFVRVMPGGQILVRYAALATVPDWLPSSANPFRPEWKENRPDHNRRGKRRSDRVVELRDPESGELFCPIVPRYSKAQVGWARQEYATWHACLLELQQRFLRPEHRLPGIDLRPFVAPAQPWDAEEIPKTLQPPQA